MLTFCAHGEYPEGKQMPQEPADSDVWGFLR
jgi:hypothetical protein